MFQLIMKHKELKSLSWSMSEFRKLLMAGEFSRPEAYEPRLQVNLFGFKFDLPVFGIVYVKIIRVRVS